MAAVVEIGPQTLDIFQSITQSNVRLYLLNYAVFYQSDYQTIKNFFTGKIKDIDSGAFVNLRKIREELKAVLEKFDQFADQLENIRFVELLSIVEDSKASLDTLSNITKWARVTIDTFGYNPNFKVQYVLGQNDSLEKVAASVMRSSNPQDDWRQIAIDNRLSEDSYTSEGGKVLNVALQNKREIKNFNITSVVDIIDKDSVKGRDLDKYIHYKDNDLATLSESETVEQSVEILATLKKRDNLDFLDHGLQSTLVVGQSKNLFNFPIVQRQMQEVFSTDDTLKDFTLNRFWFEEDKVFVNFSVRTRVGEVLELTTQI